MRKLNSTGINLFLKDSNTAKHLIPQSQLISLKGGGILPGIDDDCDGIVDDGIGRG